MTPIALAAVLGCDQPQITTLSGEVYASHDLLSPGLADATVRVVDEQGEVLGTATTNAQGSFHLDLDSGQSVFVLISADGYATTSFPGTVGIETKAHVEDHALYGLSVEELADWEAKFAGCPGVGEGGVVLGEIREYGIVDPVTGLSPTTNSGTASVQQGKTGVWAGCYLDEAGLAYDPEADFTGTAGAFAIFGVEPGLSDLLIQTLVSESDWTNDDYPLYVPDEAGAVSPWFPAFATFPLL